MIPNSQLWVEPCCYKHGHPLAILNDDGNIEPAHALAALVGFGNRTFINHVKRNKDQDLIVFDSHNKERTVVKENKVLADWIFDCDHQGQRSHWEGIRIKKFDRHSVYLHKEGLRGALWNYQPCPIGKVSNTALTLRIGGYLLDCWRFIDPNIIPVNESPNFLLQFSSHNQHSPGVHLLDLWLDFVGDREYLCGLLPMSNDVRSPEVKFRYAITDKVRATLEHRLAKYKARYQDFLIDILRQKGEFSL